MFIGVNFTGGRGPFLKVDDGETPGTPHDDKVVAVFPVSANRQTLQQLEGLDHHGNTEDTTHSHAPMGDIATGHSATGPFVIEDFEQVPDVSIRFPTLLRIDGETNLNASIPVFDASTLLVETSNFTLSADSVDAENQAGIGHAHVYVSEANFGNNWTRLGRGFGEFNLLDEARNEGIDITEVRRIAVTLQTNDHRPIVFDEVPIGALLTDLNFETGQTLTTPTGEPVSTTVSTRGRNPGGSPTATLGLVYLLDPNFDSTGRPAPLATFDGWEIEKFPGTTADVRSNKSAVNMPFITRQGNFIYVDRYGSVGRIDLRNEGLARVPGTDNVAVPALVESSPITGLQPMSVQHRSKSLLALMARFAEP